MGITGLLPFLQAATKQCNISEFKGATVAVDSYCWLHKGASACAEHLAKGEDSDVYINYALKYVNMLLKHDIHPIMVFDGNNLPAKADIESKRRENRQKAKEQAFELLRLGKANEARNYFKQCIDITPKMGLNLIKECRKLGIDCIVAPYEADAQLTFFCLKGIADLIITEDSDLMLFGCKKVMYKMDLNGAGYLVENEFLYKTMRMKPDQYSFEKFRHMCILSGCDYLKSLPGIGLKKALKFISLTAETNPEIFLNKLPSYLNMRQLTMTAEYKENFLVANATLQHQIVFDPFRRKLVPLIDPEFTGTDPSYCRNAGEMFDDETAFQIAIGNLHPISREPLDNWRVPSIAGLSRSIWSSNYMKCTPQKERRVQQNSSPKIKTTTDEEDKKYNEQLNEELQVFKVESTVDEIEIDEDEDKTEVNPIFGQEVINPFIIKINNLDNEAIITDFKISENSSGIENIPNNPIDIKNESETKKRIFSDSDSEEILVTPDIDWFEMNANIQLSSEKNEPKKLASGRKSTTLTLHHFFSMINKTQ